MSDAPYLESLLHQLKPSVTTKDIYNNDIIKYFKDVHNTTFPPKLAYYLHKLYTKVKNRESFRVIFKSPRGGGKSKFASGFEFACYYMLDAEAVNCGGSEEQARIVFDYCKAYIENDQDAATEIPEKLMLSDRVTKGGPKPQPTLISVPASPKSIRGKHPGGETKTAGILVLDEMVEMEDHLVIDALGMLRGAKPPILVCLSTFHKMFGKFQEFWDSDDMGFIKFDWDTFDVCEKCTYPCETCIPEFVEHYCQVVCKCYMDFDRDPSTLPQWKAFYYVKDERTNELLKVEGDVGKICPECGGIVDHKARFTENGWIPIVEIRDSWKLYDKEKFEVDIMGWRPSGAGLVLDPNALAKCIVSNLKWHKGAYIRAGLDWGARGMTAIVLMQRFGDGRCETIDAWHKESPKDQDIYDQLEVYKRRYGLTRIFADQSHPFQNDRLKRMGFDVIEVNFNTQKLGGVGVLRNYVEKRMLFIDNRFRLLIDQTKNWHKDKNGNIVKKNDHYPDALLCSMIEEASASEIISAYDTRGAAIVDSEFSDDPEKEYYEGYNYSEVAPVYDNIHDEYFDSEF